jgi:hypothetical protein
MAALLIVAGFQGLRVSQALTLQMQEGRCQYRKE